MASLAVGADGSFSFGSSNNSVSSLEDGPTGGGSRNGKDLWRKAALLKEHSSLFRVAHSEEMQQKWSGASIALGNDEIVGALGTDMTGETDVEKVQACAKLRVQALKASLAEGMSPREVSVWRENMSAHGTRFCCSRFNPLPLCFFRSSTPNTARCGTSRRSARQRHHHEQ